MAKTKNYGRLAKYVNTLETMAAFRRHYSILDDVRLEYRFWEDVLPKQSGDLLIPMVAIIEGGVRFPLDPLLVEFLNYFNLSSTQVSPNILRIIMGVVELNRRLGLSLTVHDIVAMYTLYSTKNKAYSLRPRNVDRTLVNGLSNTNKDMSDDYLLVSGAWHYPNQRCSTRDKTPS
jgi:hypothetical protein